MGFPGGAEVKNLPANAGDAGSIPASGRSPGEGNGNPLQYSSLEKSHGQRSLVGYTPWGRKESDTTERLSLTLSEIVKQGTNSAGKKLETHIEPGTLLLKRQ